MNSTFEVRLREQVKGSGRLIAAEKHLFHAAAGKRVRPQFLLACGKVLGVSEDQLLDVACAVELMHTASLLHDDIIDKADERREVASVNAAHGNAIAVLAGDRLFARSLMLIAKSQRADAAMLLAAGTILSMTDAVVLEVELGHTTKATTKDLLQIIHGKTGALFELCGKLAGLAANDDIAVEKLGQIGALMGRVFQINDDIDDMIEDERTGTPTLPRLMGVDIAKAEISSAMAEIDAILQQFRHADEFTELQTLIRTITRADSSKNPL